MKKTVIYPGSFDPVTLGHMDIITRASKMFDKVIVGVLVNSSKVPEFSITERIELLKEATKDIKNVEIDSFGGLLADYCRVKNADAVIRGLRAVTDFEYEFQMAITNKKLNPKVETIFLTSSLDCMYLSSSTVRDIAALNGDISNFVPSCVYERIVTHFKNK